MYHSDLIINGIDADKLIALQLEKALSRVEVASLIPFSASSGYPVAFFRLRCWHPVPV